MIADRNLFEGYHGWVEHGVPVNANLVAWEPEFSRHHVWLGLNLKAEGMVPFVPTTTGCHVSVQPRSGPMSALIPFTRRIDPTRLPVQLLSWPVRMPIRLSDAADPNVAIAAMQAMNESMRNPVFAPAFFATPFVLAAAAGGIAPTIAVSVPMNEALALVEVPLESARARQGWNTARAAFSGLALVLAGLGTLRVGRSQER